MIPVTRLNGKELLLNPDLVQWVEETPDTIVTLVTSEKLVVREPMAELARLVLAYRAAVGGAAAGLRAWREGVGSA
ncbi:MAG: flagellar FlbD family protein [Planctomycetes bacterium]|nr:flagellar FlbD family protein [Planctomycetota bacterium]